MREVDELGIREVASSHLIFLLETSKKYFQGFFCMFLSRWSDAALVKSTLAVSFHFMWALTSTLWTLTRHLPPEPEVRELSSFRPNFEILLWPVFSSSWGPYTSWRIDNHGGLSLQWLSESCGSCGGQSVIGQWPHRCQENCWGCKTPDFGKIILLGQLFIAKHSGCFIDTIFHFMPGCSWISQKNLRYLRRTSFPWGSKKDFSWSWLWLSLTIFEWFSLNCFFLNTMGKYFLIKDHWQFLSFY